MTAYEVEIAPHTGVSTEQNVILEDAVAQALLLLRTDYPRLASLALHTGVVLAEATT